MTSGIVNQNDIAKIVKSQTESAKNILTCLSDLISSKQIYMKINVPELSEKFIDVCKSILVKDGMLDFIVELIHKFQNISKQIKGTWDANKLYKKINSYLTCLKNLIDKTDLFIAELAGLTINQLAYKKLAEITNFFNSIINNISNIKINLKFFIKLQLIRFAFKSILKTLHKLSNGFTLKSILDMMRLSFVFMPIQLVINGLTNIFKTINDSKIGLKYIIKLYSIRLGIKSILSLFRYIRRQRFGLKSAILIAKKLACILIGIKSIQYIFDTIAEIKFGMKTILKVYVIQFAAKWIIKIAKIMRKIIRAAGKFSFSDAKNLLILAFGLRCLRSIFSSIKRAVKGWFLIKKLKKMNEAVYIFNSICKNLNKLKINSAKIIKTLLNIQLIIKPLNKIFKAISKNIITYILFLPAGLLFKLGLKELRFIIKGIISLNKHRFGKSIENKAKSIKSAVFSIIKIMVAIVLAIPIVVAFSVAAIVFMLGMLVLKLIIMEIKWLARSTKFKTQFKIAMLGNIILSVVLIMGIIILASPIAVLFIAAAIIFALAMVALWGLLKLIAWVGKTCCKPKVLLGLLGVTLLLLFLIGLTAILLIITLMAVPIVKHALDLLLFFGILLLVTIAVGAIGFVAAMAISILIPALIGLALITLAIGLIWIISKMLQSIVEANIDVKGIRKTVAGIIGCIKEIINSIFNGDDAEHSEGDGFFASLFGAISSLFGAVGTIIKALISIVILVAAFIAVSVILLIAGELKLLELLNLDVAKIKSNVSIVLDTAKAVVNGLFEDPDKQEDTKNNQPWYITVLEFFGVGKFLEIIKAILAIGQLVLTVIAVTLIMFIATQLRILQTIELDGEKIKANVGIVLDTGASVWGVLLDHPDKQEDTKNNQPWYITVLEFFGVGKFLEIIKAILAIGQLVLTIIAIYLISWMASQLRDLQTLELDGERIKTNVGIVLTTGLTVWTALTEDVENGDDHQSKSWFESVLNFFGVGQFLEIIKAILAIGKLALSIVAMKLILFLADQLRQLQEIPLDSEKIKNNVDLVLTTGMSVFDKVFEKKQNPKDAEKKSWWETFLSWVGNNKFVQILEAILAVGKLALSLIAIHMILIMAKDLEEIAKIKFDGKTVMAKTDQILNTAEDIFKMLNYRTLPTKKADNDFEGFLRAITPDFLESAIDGMMNFQYLAKLMCSIGSIDAIAKMLARIQNTNISNAKKAAENVCDVAESILLTLGNKKYSIGNAKDAINVIDDFIDIAEEFDDDEAQNAQKVANAFVKFAKTVHATDVNKLKEMKYSLLYMSKFSESINGNFEELARVLVEKIAPILEELKDVMNDVNGTITKQGKLDRINNVKLANGEVDVKQYKSDGGDAKKAEELAEKSKNTNKKRNESYEGMQDIYDCLLGINGHKGVKVYR